MIFTMYVCINNFMIAINKCLAVNMLNLLDDTSSIELIGPNVRAVSLVCGSLKLLRVADMNVVAGARTTAVSMA